MNLAGAGSYFVPAAYGAYRSYRAYKDYNSSRPRSSIKSYSGSGTAAVNHVLAAADAARAAAYNQGRNARVGGLIDIEKKFLDCAKGDSNLSTAWAIQDPTTGCTGTISVPAQGDGPSARDGRTYTIHSIHLKVRLSQVPVESDLNPLGQSLVRIVLVWDTQANGAAPTAAKIFSQANSALSFRNLENSRRFIVLKDKTFTMNPNPLNQGAANSFASAGTKKIVKMNKSFKSGIKVRCQAETADIASAADTAFHIFAMYEGGQVVQLGYWSRLRFTG